MTETNNWSALNLDDRGQAEPSEMSIGNCSKLSLGKLSRIKRSLSRIEKIEPQNVIPYQAWIIMIPWANHVSQNYKYPESCRGFSRLPN